VTNITLEAVTLNQQDNRHVKFTHSNRPKTATKPH